MRRIPWLVWIILTISLIVLGACGPTAEPEPTATATVTPMPESPPPLEWSTPPPLAAEPVNLDDLPAPASPGACEAYPLPELPIPPETAEDWAKGASAADARYVIYEYSDFQCPGCSGVAPMLDQYLEDNPDVRLVYRHFPLTQIHELAMLTAETAEAAGAQGKFWDMHDLLFADAQEAYTLIQMLQSQSMSETQQEEAMEHLYTLWVMMEPEAAREQMNVYAEMLDLDVAAFNQDLDEGVYTEKVEMQYQQAVDLELSGTPAFIFNEYLFPSDLGLSYMGLQSFRALLDRKEELLYAAPPEMTVDVEAAYQATLQTSQGAVTVDLWPEMAPTSVNNFIFLAEEGWYNGAEFFFVQDDFVAVTGDPTNTTVGYPGYQCSGDEREFVPNTGLMWMLSNGQFFFTLGPEAYELMVRQSPYPAEFSLVGMVIEGMDVVQSLTRISVGDPTAPVADVLQNIQIRRP